MADPTLKIMHSIRAPIGGAFRHVRDLIIEQSALGHDVGLICSQIPDNDYLRTLIEDLKPCLSLGVHTISMSKTLSFDELSGIWRFGAILRKTNVEIIHGHGAKAGLMVRLWSQLNRLWRHKAICVYTPHGGVLHYQKKSLKGRLFFTIERLAARVTDGFIFVCDFERRTFEEKVTPSLSKSEIILNGLADEEFEPVQSREGSADFLFIGELRHLKGTDLFINALSTLAAEDDNIKAVIVGAGPEESIFKLQASDCQLNNNIKFFTPMQAREAFALASVVVVPSRAESLPYIVLEAVAAGKPVIVSDVGGMSEIVGPDSRSLFISENLEMLTSQMRAALSRPDLFSPVKTIGTEALKARFSRASMAQKVTRFYFNLT